MTLALAYRAGLKSGLDNLVAKYIRKFGLHSTSLSPRPMKALSPCTEMERKNYFNALILFMNNRQQLEVAEKNEKLRS
jgi:hypothetical protein